MRTTKYMNTSRNNGRLRTAVIRLTEPIQRNSNIKTDDYTHQGVSTVVTRQAFSSTPLYTAAGRIQECDSEFFHFSPAPGKVPSISKGRSVVLKAVKVATFFWT